MHTNKIYGYTEPHTNGVIKIGMTTDDDACNYIDKHIINPRKSSKRKEFTFLFSFNAIKSNGEKFKDHDIHRYLSKLGYPKLRGDDGSVTEEFDISEDIARLCIEGYINGISPKEMQQKIKRPNSFSMREEQQEAVDKTAKYFNGHGKKFLWNAKMRFGKTFATYQLANKMKWTKILILTYKPSVINSWRDELLKHEDFEGWFFYDHENTPNENDLSDGKVVWFASYQDILGNGDEIKGKHSLLFDTEWDCVVVDEYHYGAHGENAESINESKEDDEYDDIAPQSVVDSAIKKLSTSFNLYLSGTPFKVLAEGRFAKDEVFTWTYTDEQKKKNERKYLELCDASPYACLPDISLYAYALDDELMSKAKEKGKNEFSLNYFFKAEYNEEKEAHEFLNTSNVSRWLDVIMEGSVSNGVDEAISNSNVTRNTTYPYSNQEGDFPELVKHSIWYMNGVSECMSMRSLLKNDKHWTSLYHIILVAGNVGGTSEKALQTVLNGIKKAKRKGLGTITLTCGKLMTGVSVPEWSSILFLRDLQSAETYFQAAFRVQTPNIQNGEIVKRKCAIFDFSPSRSLNLINEYAIGLHNNEPGASKSINNIEVIKEFISYLPVLIVANNTLEKASANEILTYELHGIDAKGLAGKISSSRMVNLSSDTLESLLSNTEQLEILKAIIKHKTYSQASGRKEREVDFDTLNKVVSSDTRCAELKFKKNNKIISDEEKEELREANKEKKLLDKERKKITEVLKTLLSRIPLFMFLTDESETGLSDILNKSVKDNEDNDYYNTLFEEATGIDISKFKVLVDAGIIVVKSMDAYILQFKSFEDNNYEELKKIIRQDI